MSLFMVSGFSTLMGSLPVILHRYLNDSHRYFWESLSGGVMVSASVFSLLLPAWKMAESSHALILGVLAGSTFIVFSARLMKLLTENLARQRAFLFVFVMALHNIPEGLSVGFDVAALGWDEALSLSVVIFIQNIPEGFVSSLAFLLAGFSLPAALLANAFTALIETLSAASGYVFAKTSVIQLPLLLSFAGASMMTVVSLEFWQKKSDGEKISLSGFLFGLILCALLDLFL